MTVYGSIAAALCTFWFEARVDTAFEFSFMNLVLAALFIIFALWVRRKGSFWPVGILLLLASSSALWDISYLTTYHLSKLEVLLFVGPQVAILLAQVWILRAFIYLSSKGGSLTETPAIQVD